MINALRIILLGVAILNLAVATSLENIDSSFIDFTQIPSGEIQLFQFSLFVVFLGLMILIPMVGGEDSGF